MVLDSVNKQALITLVTKSQEEVFGCRVDGFIEAFNMTSYLDMSANA